MHTPSGRAQQIKFEDREQLVSLLCRVQRKFSLRTSWPEYFARTIERYAKANGFIEITFKVERDALEGESLARALKDGFADPRTTMNALRLWKADGQSVLFKLTEDRELHYPFHLNEVAVSLPAYTQFEQVCERIEQAVVEARKLREAPPPQMFLQLLEQDELEHKLTHPKAVA